MIQVIIFAVFFAGIGIWILISALRKKKFKKNAITAFSQSTEVDDSNILMLDTGDAIKIINYLKYLLEGSTNNKYSSENDVGESSTNEFLDKKVIINIQDSGDSIFIHIDTLEKNIEVLINPKSQNDTPIALPFESFDVVKLIHKTYSVTTGSGKNRSTSYYNKYITNISVSSDILSEITVYNNKTQVSSDKGVLEISSRRIGELFAKLLKTDIIRTNGARVRYNDLDASVLEKLDNNAPRITLNKNIFTTSKMNDSYVINRLLYYKKLRLVLGIIVSSVIFIIGLIFGIKYAGLLSGLPINALFVIFLIFWIKSSRYKEPHEKPMIYVYKDQIITKPKFKNNVMVNGINIDLSNIEEIIVRFEKSKGFIVKALSDDKIFNIATFSHENTAQFIRGEILSLLKELKV